MSGLQIQTTQNPHTQAATNPSTNLHGFGDIKAYLQQIRFSTKDLLVVYYILQTHVLI